MIENCANSLLQLEGIAEWFRSLERIIHLYGIADEDIWKFDETGFQIGVGRDHLFMILTSLTLKRTLICWLKGELQ